VACHGACCVLKVYESIKVFFFVSGRRGRLFFIGATWEFECAFFASARLLTYPFFLSFSQSLPFCFFNARPSAFRLRLGVAAGARHAGLAALLLA
jgi:hypothetical protein